MLRSDELRWEDIIIVSFLLDYEMETFDTTIPLWGGSSSNIFIFIYL